MVASRALRDNDPNGACAMASISLFSVPSMAILASTHVNSEWIAAVCLADVGHGVDK